MPKTQLTTQAQDCVLKCLDCARICKKTAKRCLQMEGSPVASKHISLLNKCARVQTTAKLIQEKSMVHLDQGEVYQKVCGTCALDCEKLQENFIKDCAIACEGTTLGISKS